MTDLSNIDGNCTYARSLAIGRSEYISMAGTFVTILAFISTSVITHRFINVTLRKAKKLNTPFYLLFLHDRILVLVFSAHWMLVFLLPLTGLMTNLICEIRVTAVLTAAYAMEYYFNYAVIYSSISISLLRVAAVLNPVGSRKSQGRLSVILVVFVYSLPWLTMWFLWRNSLASLIVTGVGCGMDLVCFFITVAGWRKLASSRGASSLRRSERSLLYMTFSVCVSLSVNFALQVLFYKSIFAETLFFIRGFIYDILLFVPTWTFYFTHPVFKNGTKFEQSSAGVITVLPSRS
ncbi:unnamed protein product [Nippostrongylus brasiliensis]|uniref:G_PROTEIN_RECEP_F1_2 domain-containing protein n=1 Tax=Nippostrongylus brasiliensis TaxID=27835 RepID=A0A0N4XCT9_NIPBR|nr:unnamed protein product [Nippostrongylus brasiliensis]